MLKEKLSAQNAAAIIIIIQISNNIIFGFSSLHDGSGVWLSLIAGVPVFFALMGMYARMVFLLPGKNIFQMTQYVFGRTVGIIVSVLFAFYFITLAGMIRGNYTQFVHLVLLSQTPYIVICLAFFCVCTYIAKSGVQVLGKWCKLMTLGAFVAVAAMVLASLHQADLQNLLPVNNRSLKELIPDSLNYLSLPFGETVLLLSMTDRLEEKSNPYKIFIFGTLISIPLLVVVLMHNIAVLGETLAANSYYPFYKAASVIRMGSIDTRIESVVSFALMLVGISKVAVAVTAGCEAVSSVFNLNNGNALIIPISFLTVAFSVIILRTTMETSDFVNIYRIYALPFQVIIPAAVWIGAEIKTKSGKGCIGS